MLKSLLFRQWRFQISLQVNLSSLDSCIKIVKVSFKEFSFCQRKFTFSLRFLPKIYFRLFYFFLSAVLVDFVYWVMMDGHATIQEYCIIYLTTMLNSLTHIITWTKLCFFPQMELQVQSYMTSKIEDCFMQMLEVETRELLLFFQEMVHGVRYILQVNIKSSFLQVKILVS